MPNAREPQQLERLAPGRDQIGEVGDIVSESPGDFISVHPGDFVGIRMRGKKCFQQKLFEKALKEREGDREKLAKLLHELHPGTLRPSLAHAGLEAEEQQLPLLFYSTRAL